MAHPIRRPSWWLPERELTPESACLGRRELLARLGFAGLGAAAALAGCRPHRAEADGDGAWRAVNVPTGNPHRHLYPARRNPAWVLDRPMTSERATATYNNFYEFSADKEKVWKLAAGFPVRPWEVEIDGLVERPGTYAVDDLVGEFGLEERAYRHRCVEAWAMAVPWTGFPFAKLVGKVGVRGEAAYVELVTFHDPDRAPGQARDRHYPWPYHEAMTMAEATHELAFVATGIYGHELPVQNGAPWRLVLPWKYGFKSIKSMVRIRFTDRRPRTFWNSFAPEEYGFLANVDPSVPHPRWSQARERMIDTGEFLPTRPYNGYGEQVARLYA